MKGKGRLRGKNVARASVQKVEAVFVTANVDFDDCSTLTRRNRAADPSAALPIALSHIL